MRKKEQLKPLCITYRTTCGFIFLAALLALIVLYVYVADNSFDAIAILGSTILLICLHVTGTITLTAYAPIYFRFVHLPLEEDKED